MQDFYSFNAHQNNDNLFGRGLLNVHLLSGLRALDLRNCPLLDDAALLHVVRCSSLTHLALAGCSRITDSGLSLLSCCPSLEHVSVPGRNATGSGLETWTQLPKLHTVELFCGHYIYHLFLKNLVRCRNLRHLVAGASEVIYAQEDPVTSADTLVEEPLWQLETLDWSPLGPLPPEIVRTNTLKRLSLFAPLRLSHHWKLETLEVCPGEELPPSIAEKFAEELKQVRHLSLWPQVAELEIMTQWTSFFLMTCFQLETVKVRSTVPWRIEKS